jgi:hypothetical protein
MHEKRLSERVTILRYTFLAYLLVIHILRLELCVRFSSSPCILNASPTKLLFMGEYMV